MPTSVVTGGAGFLGSHLCDHLLAQGHRVICVDNLETGSLENIAHIKGDEFAFLNHDVVEPIHVDGPVDYLFHLAALASPVDYLRAPLASLKVGSYGTHNALGLAKWKRARFLISSTSEVYGDPQVHPQPETYWGNVNPIGPRGVYDEAKRYAEALTMTYHAQQGVDTCIARIFNTYGPRMRRNDGRASVNFLNQAIEGKPLTVYGDGSQTRSLCYVDDLIRGIYLLADERRAPAGEHRQPGSRGDDARARTDGDSRDRLDERGRVRGSADRRSPGAAPRHHAGPPGARLGAGDRPRGRAPPLGEGARPGAGDRLGMRWAGVIVAVCLTAFVAATARPAEGSRYLRVGIYDEAQTLYGPVDKTFALFKQLHVQEVRLNLYWGGKYGVAKSRPRRATNPADPAYDWSLYDRTGRVRRAERRPCAVLGLRHARVGERRQGDERRSDAGRRSAELRARRRQALQRHLQGDGRADPAGGEGVARLERAEQPDLPRTAVPQDRDAAG